MPVIARAVAKRPRNHGRIVEVYPDRRLFPRTGIYDLRVIIFNPTIGVHAHNLPGIKGRNLAFEIAERIGQSPVEVVPS